MHPHCQYLTNSTIVSLQCVIRSKVPITDVADYGIDCSSSSNSGDEERHKILVSAADGNVWEVTLPAKLQPGVSVLTGDLLLERSSSECGGEWCSGSASSRGAVDRACIGGLGPDVTYADTESSDTVHVDREHAWQPGVKVAASPVARIG